MRVTFYDVDAPDGRVEASLWYEYTTRTVRVRDGVETIEPVQMKILLASDDKRLPKLRP